MLREIPEGTTFHKTETVGRKINHSGSKKELLEIKGTMEKEKRSTEQLEDKSEKPPKHRNRRQSPRKATGEETGCVQLTHLLRNDAPETRTE